MTLGLRLLGPLEFSVEGVELDLGGSRQRVVLAMLALNANRVTTVEQLIDAVWSTSPPTTARAQIQICISGLRKVLSDSSVAAGIRTRPPGYLLEIPADELDTAQFAGLVETARAHVDAGRKSEAVATLRSALALWHGPALAGVRSDLVRRGAALLEDARLAAVMERIRLDLELGRHEEVVGELSALVEEHPLREPLHEQLMLALYRSGRQAEALDVCRRVRVTLVEELGIDPGQRLQQLERAILNRDPALDLTTMSPGPVHTRPTKTDEQLAVVPRRLPASIGDFTGRRGQLVEIKRALSDDDPETVRYGTRIVAISGKGGVGKSTLAVRAAHELRDVYPDGHLYGVLEAPNGVDRAGAVLARFLRALGVDGAAIPEDLEERGEMYRSRLAGKRVLVVLDGATSEDHVLPLLPAGPGCAVLVTSRARLSGLPGARFVDVDVFDVDLSLEMLGKIVGEGRVAAENQAAVELVKFCGGLPLAMRIAGARLASRPHWRLDILVARLRNTARRLDELSYRGLELRSSIGLTYRALPAQAKRLFRLFALITTPDFPEWTAAALLDIDPYDAAEVVENLVEAQLLDTVRYPGERLRFRFHDLIRVYASERLDADESGEERSAAIRRLLGAWLARAEEAHRREYGGDFTLVHGVAPRWHPTGEDVTIDNPMEWLESERRSLVSAVHLAAEAELDEMAWDLAHTSVTLFEVKGYFDDWRDTTECALDLAERKGNRRGLAVMQYSLGTMRLHQKRLDEAEGCFESALENFRAEGDVHGSALVLRNAATVDRLRNRAGAVVEKYNSALEGMRAVGDQVGEAHVLQSLAKVWIDEGDVDRARELLDQALVCCKRVNYMRGEAQVLNRFAEFYLDTNQVEQAHQALNRVLLIVRNIGDRIGEAYALYRLGVVRQRTGRLDNAETTLQHALSLARRVGERLIEGQALYALGEIALATGLAEAGAEYVDDARRLFEEFGSTVWHAKSLILLSDVFHGRGDLDLARSHVDDAIGLLSEVDSMEAARLRVRLQTTRSALLSCGAAGEQRG
ncbi:AfsR/SARP family transcriptional regulator [Actinophytocola sp.]|uniref:AfsR/SARP family transcriptional regulator n=1 Tax=Actinophytocola sp. TaxID=1872138 RepID=UPI003D6C175C